MEDAHKTVSAILRDFQGAVNRMEAQRAEDSRTIERLEEELAKSQRRLAELETAPSDPVVDKTLEAHAILDELATRQREIQEDATKRMRVILGDMAMVASPLQGLFTDANQLQEVMARFTSPEVTDPRTCSTDGLLCDPCGEE